MAPEVLLEKPKIKRNKNKEKLKSKLALEALPEKSKKNGKK